MQGLILSIPFLVALGLILLGWALARGCGG
jgi:hypothetical protein